MSGYKHSRLESANTKPKVDEIEIAEIAVNLEDKLLYTKDHNGEIVSVGGGASPDATGKAFNELATDGSNKNASEWSAFRLTPKSINHDVTIKSGSTGTIGSFTLEDGNTITVEDGARVVVI
jgi:hypothetical protein